MRDRAGDSRGRLVATKADIALKQHWIEMGQAFANKLRSASPYERCDIKCPAEIYTKAESTRGIASNGGLCHSRPNEAFQSERLPTNPGEF